MILGKRDIEYVKQLEETVKKQQKQIEKEIPQLRADIEEITKECEDLKRMLGESCQEDSNIINIESFAKSNNLTYSQVAKILGVSATTLSKYRKDINSIPSDKKQKIIYDMIEYETNKIIKG